MEGLLHANFEPKLAYLSYARLTARVGQVLHLTGTADPEGIAHFNIPATFVARPGDYVVLAIMDQMTPTAMATYEATNEERELS